MPACIPVIEISANAHFHSPRGGNAENNPAPPLIDTAHAPSLYIAEIFTKPSEKGFSPSPSPSFLIKKDSF
jgi:hypothetical protein